MKKKVAQKKTIRTLGEKLLSGTTTSSPKKAGYIIFGLPSAIFVKLVR
jgi:hypothetical protein